ncbi:hypothetical protein ACA910_011306 [Epithemia clementina (nom. ined.)]
MAAAFALGPGRNNNVLDYDNDQGAVKLYHKAIAPMEDLFDGTPEKVHIFLANVADKARRYNWDAILTVAVAPTTYYLITQYGQVTNAQVQAHAATYVGTQTRNAQNSDMLYHFLMALLTSAFKGQVLLHSNEYTVTANAVTVPDGPSLLKQIVSLTYIDTRATASHIRSTLVDMTLQLDHYGGDINKFNHWVKLQVEKLAARGQEASDLLTYLWKAYAHAPDPKFIKYMDDLKDEYKDGRANYTTQEVMTLAENKFKARIQTGEWAKPSDEQAEIVALTAQVETLKKNMASRPKASLTKPPAPAKGKGTPNLKVGVKKQDKPKPKVAPKAPPAPWKLVAPGSGEAETKTKDGKEFHWCRNHETNGMWVRHKPDECSNKSHPNHPNHDPSHRPALHRTAMATTIDTFGDTVEDSDQE